MGKQLGFETKLLAAILSTILLVVALATTTWLTLKEERNQARVVEHIHDILDSISEIKVNLLLPESIVLGYVISGFDEDLAKLPAIKSTREKALHRLKDLSADNPIQLKNCLRLSEALNVRKAIAQHVILLRKTEGFDAARVYLLNTHAAEQRKDLFQMLREMEDEESLLLAAHSAELSRVRTIALTLGIILTPMLFILLATTYMLIRRQVRTTMNTQYALERSSARVTTILNTVADGILTIDSQGIVETMNHAAEHIFGYTIAEVVGRNIKMLMPEPDQSQHDSHMMRYFATAEKHIIGIGREVQGLRKDGSVFPIELSVNEMLLGSERHFTGVLRDISSRKKSEQALIDARDEADRANRAKSEFLSNMSHELRTPMNAILGFGQLLENDDTLPDELKDYVQEILKAGAHLLQLINEVLDLAKIESGHIDLSLEPVEVCSIVNECLSLVNTLADKRRIRLSHKGLEGAIVRADRTRLRQALLNLISNAIKYNHEGGSVHIEVCAAETDQLSMAKDRLCIRVTDTGPGISTERLAELFQPFSRLDAENSGIEGTGIGLTITRRIVEMMGGAVNVKSEVGVGSTFCIELPHESDSETNHNIPALERDTPVPAIDATQQLVLCIEDNPANLKLVTQILGRRKHIHLLTAHTPELGIELALARKPDLILLDINMPHIDGYQVMSIFKADASLKNIPVIAITAKAMSRDIERGKAAGFVDYLTKPLNIEHFLKTVEHCLTNDKPKKRS